MKSKTTSGSASDLFLDTYLTARNVHRLPEGGTWTISPFADGFCLDYMDLDGRSRVVSPVNRVGILTFRTVGAAYRWLQKHSSAFTVGLRLRFGGVQS